jgi:hypothetical protein
VVGIEVSSYLLRAYMTFLPTEVVQERLVVSTQIVEHFVLVDRDEGTRMVVVVAASFQ